MGEWLTYTAAAQRLGMNAEAVAMRAKRKGWPKRSNSKRNDLRQLVEVLVPGELLAHGPQEPRERQQRRPTPGDVANALRANIAILEGEIAELRTDKAFLKDLVGTQQDEIKAAMTKADNLQSELDAAQARIAAAEALAAERASQIADLKAAHREQVRGLEDAAKRADDDRKTLQHQADQVREKLAGAEAKAARAAERAREAHELLVDAEQEARGLRREIQSLHAEQHQRRKWWPFGR